MKELSSKEELIGTTWKCPICKEEIIITEEGLQHYKDNHFWNFDLQQYYEMKKWSAELYAKRAHQLLYGKGTEIEQSESFYFVELVNSDDTIHHTGKKSRKTGKIYLCGDNYEADLTKPIEETDFHFVRNSTSFDL